VEKETSFLVQFGTGHGRLPKDFSAGKALPKQDQAEVKKGLLQRFYKLVKDIWQSANEYD
jgi:hypothetical protein